MVQKTQVWIQKYGSWLWKAVLVLTVLTNAWMQLKFTMKEEFKEFKSKYWQNFSEHKSEYNELKERVTILEIREEENRRSP